MTNDPRARLRAANPVGGDPLADDEALRTARLAVEREPMPAPTALGTRARLRFVPAGRGRATLALGGTMTAAAVAALVLSAGGAPAPAQAFPILRSPGRDIRETAFVAGSVVHSSLVGWPSPSEFMAALKDAHSFSIPAVDGWQGTGYALASPDGQNLCLLAMGNELATGSSTGHGLATASRGCATTATVEQQGLLIDVPYGSFDGAGELGFAALVPAGASVSLSENGATTSVAATDGVATGVAQTGATLTITVGGAAYTQTLTTMGTAASNGAEGASGATGATGASGATGATGATSTT